MDRIKFVLHKGLRLLQIDFSNCGPEETIKLLKEARRVIRKEPENSLYLLTLVTNTHFNREVAHEVKAYVEANAPFVKASAVVGVSGLQGIIINGAKSEIDRTIAVFEDAEKAKDWLAESALPMPRRVFR